MERVIARKKIRRRNPPIAAPSPLDTKGLPCPSPRTGPRLLIYELKPLQFAYFRYFFEIFMISDFGF
ncbi:MAG TPA: hypothetical protein DDW23_00050 [Planctomycetes bacterium]|nr:hypothetical protein [Planctomycetota bacterium]